VNPTISHILVSVGAGAVGVVLAPVAAVGIVGALGFSAAGVVAGECPFYQSRFIHLLNKCIANSTIGSFAAAVQAGGGNIVAGSLFALAQSIGAGGVVPAIFSAISGAIGALLGAIVYGYGALGGTGGNFTLSQTPDQGSSTGAA